MAEENTVIKTVENVDQLFSEIVVNGESHVSDRYVPPAIQPQETVPVSEEEEEEQQTQPAQATQGQDVHAVELNDILHDFVDPSTVQGLANEVSARTQADNLLQNSVNNIAGSVNVLQTTVGGLVEDVSTLQGSVNAINAKIPNQASSENQLADKNFVNSSISTNTANFLGTYTSLADIEAIQNPTNNDYAFLDTTDSAGNTVYKRYKYNATQNAWLFEYDLNNSSFTADQWATINSGLTQESVDEDIQEAIEEGLQALDDIPVGMITAYYGSSDPANGKWLICDGRDTTGTSIELETHYPSLYIFLGSTNVLPDFRNRAVMGANSDVTLGNISSVGDTQLAQLPKVTGTFRAQGWGSGSSGNVSGAITLTGRGEIDSGTSSASNYPKDFKFDSSNASASSDHLGNNPYTTDGEVRPANVRCNWIIKATSSTDTAPIPSSDIQTIEQYVDNGITSAFTWIDITNEFTVNLPTSNFTLNTVKYSPYLKQLKIVSTYSTTVSSGSTFSISLTYNGSRFVFASTSVVNFSMHLPDTATNGVGGFEPSYWFPSSTTIRVSVYNRNSGTNFSSGTKYTCIVYL